MTLIPSFRQILGALWFWLLLLMLIAAAHRSVHAAHAEDPPSTVPAVSSPATAAISDQDRIQLLLAQRSALLAEIRRLQALVQLHEAASAAKPSSDAMDSLYKQITGKVGCRLDAEFRCLPPPTPPAPAPAPVLQPSPAAPTKSLDTPAAVKP